MITLALNKDEDTPILLETISQTLGVEVVGGEMVPIISKNSYIPISKSMVFTNSDEEDSIDVNIYSGERRYVKDNEYIGTLKLCNLEKKRRGNHKIKVVFEISSNNQLIVKVDNHATHLTFNKTLINKKDNYEEIIKTFEEKIHDMEL